MWTVTLKLWPQVVTTHLLGGFTMLSTAVAVDDATEQSEAGVWAIAN